MRINSDLEVVGKIVKNMKEMNEDIQAAEAAQDTIKILAINEEDIEADQEIGYHRERSSNIISKSMVQSQLDLLDINDNSSKQELKLSGRASKESLTT